MELCFLARVTILVHGCKDDTAKWWCNYLFGRFEIYTRTVKETKFRSEWLKIYSAFTGEL